MASMALSGKVPIGDVPIGEFHTGLDGLFGEVHVVVILVLLLDVVEDLDGLIHRGRLHQITFWKRRSNAPSFSMYWRYSSKVVAPMHWISPRAKAGLNMLLASKEPLAPPAPTMVWISSMKRITSGLFSNSFITAFMRSSN
jgi:hypothetical protein